jgi:hypothetical protein
MTYPNIMLDIECLDTAPTNRAVIVSVGMVKFDIREIDDWTTLREPERILYVTLPLQMQLDAGRTVGASTLQWWFKQTSPVQAALLELDEDGDSIALLDSFDNAMESMRAFLAPVMQDDHHIDEEVTARAVALWGKPAHFDMPKLETLFTDFGYNFPVPWYCYKCMSSYKVAAKLLGIQNPKVPSRASGKFDHNALYDAQEQVLELQGWYQSLRSLKHSDT